MHRVVFQSCVRTSEGLRVKDEEYTAHIVEAIPIMIENKLRELGRSGRKLTSIKVWKLAERSN